MNVIQGTKTSILQWNRLLDSVVMIIKYNESKIYYDIYIKVLYDLTVSYLTVSTNDFLNTNNNEIAFPEPTRLFEERFEIKVQEGSVIKYLNLLTFQSLLGFSVDNTDHIMKQVNKWFPNVIFRKVDTAFRPDYNYEK